jgi:hypothetical protein
VLDRHARRAGFTEPQPDFNESELSASPPQGVDQCGERLMTELDVRREIFYVLTECLGDDGRPILEYIRTAQELATAVFRTLAAKELLKLDDDRPNRSTPRASSP